MPKHQDSKIFLSATPKQDCLAASVCVTQAPMWSAQAASLTRSYDGSESGPRYERSVSSSSSLIGLDWNRPETPCCLIGWDWGQWKNLPLPFPVCMCVCTVHTYICVYAKHVHIRCMSDCSNLLHSLIYKCRLPHPTWYNILKKTEVTFHPGIQARWVTAASLMRWCIHTHKKPPSLVLQKEWASQLSEVGSIGQKLKVLQPHRLLCVRVSKLGRSSL